MIITAGRLGEQPCWSKSWTGFLGMHSAGRNELIHRLLAGRCEICGDTAGLEVHHIRNLAHPARPGRRDKPTWVHLMAMRRRKALVTCRRCHQDTHAGRATTTPYSK